MAATVSNKKHNLRKRFNKKLLQTSRKSFNFENKF